MIQTNLCLAVSRGGSLGTRKRQKKTEPLRLLGITSRGHTYNSEETGSVPDTLLNQRRGNPRERACVVLQHNGSPPSKRPPEME